MALAILVGGELSMPFSPDSTFANLMQGLLTLLIGLSAFILMPPGPCQTANWARGKSGWFTER